MRVRVEAGLGPPPALSARAVTPVFVDGIYPARKQLLLRGAANEGDAVECIVTLADSNAVTIRVEAQAGEAATSVVARLAEELRRHPLLKTEQGVRLLDVKVTGEQVEFALEANQAGAPGIALLLKYRILPSQPGAGLGPPVTYDGRLGDTLDLLSARALLQFACGWEELGAEFALDTTAYADGPHTLRLVARDGTAVQTHGHRVLKIMIQNTPAAKGRPGR